MILLEAMIMWKNYLTYDKKIILDIIKKNTYYININTIY